MNSSNNSNSGAKGIGFTGLLTIVFITLKLCGIINWSWWWVLSPIFISTVSALIILPILGIIVAIKMKGE